MNKKILATLLIASMAITGLFAYSGKNAILEASQEEVPYTFVIQYNDLGATDSATLSGLILTVAEQTTPANFTVETKLDGNSGTAINFNTTITTGEFVEATVGSTATDNTGKYPVLVDVPLTGLTYASTTAGSFDAADISTYATTFAVGQHLAGTVIAQFKLSYEGDAAITAGAYRSTSTVAITTN